MKPEGSEFIWSIRNELAEGVIHRCFRQLYAHLSKSRGSMRHHIGIYFLNSSGVVAQRRALVMFVIVLMPFRVARFLFCLMCDFSEYIQRSTCSCVLFNKQVLNFVIESLLVIPAINLMSSKGSP